MHDVTATQETASDAAFLQSIMKKVSALEAPRPQHRRAPASCWDMPGFAAGSRVMTTFGPVPVELIRVHDPIRTASGGTRQVRRVNKITLDRELLARNPEAQPIRIAAGALGKGLPENDLLTSPGQVLVPTAGDNLGWRTAASDIRGRHNVVRVPTQNVTYYVFELDEPDTACVEGAAVFMPVWSED